MFGLLKTQLTALQQEGYSVFRFLTWLSKNSFTFQISTKKPLVITNKIKIILILSILQVLVGVIWLPLVLRFAVLGAFLVFPFIFLITSLLLLWPYEKINRFLTVQASRGNFLGRPDLEVIGIAGSFGKTSVKDFLFTILENNGEVVKTPESYNTVFGIKKVIDFELLPKTKRFICEMGAYNRGEIAELCRMIPPQFGILTAIGSQHLERFGNLANTTLAKFELIDSVKPQNALVNLDNVLIREHLKDKKYAQVKTYSISDPKANFFVKSYQMFKEGMSFGLDGHQYFVNLFGSVNLSNIVAVVSMAKMLKVPEKQIIEKLKQIRPSPHRLELKQIGRCTLVDNAFSSNESGFQNILQDLKKLKGKKAIITPGIIELGERTAEVHERLGSLASGIFDKHILVGKSERTTNFEKGLKNKKNIEYIDNATNLWPIINKLAQTHNWILLENDLPDAI